MWNNLKKSISWIIHDHSISKAISNFPQGGNYDLPWCIIRNNIQYTISCQLYICCANNYGTNQTLLLFQRIYPDGGTKKKSHRQTSLDLGQSPVAATQHVTLPSTTCRCKSQTCALLSITSESVMWPHWNSQTTCWRLPEAEGCRVVGWCLNEESFLHSVCA